MIPVLQNRWKLTGTTLVYYGLPQPPRLFRRRISLSPSAARTVAMLDGRRPLEDYPNLSALRRLIRRGVVVDVKDRKAAPASLDEARFCRRCAANDYAIPGLELDENGRPLRWRVENSWGKDAGVDGYYVMSDDWFTEYTYQVVVHKKYLTAEELAAYEADPIMLEPWDPMGSLAK